jgi:hypothetical protein
MARTVGRPRGGGQTFDASGFPRPAFSDVLARAEELLEREAADYDDEREEGMEEEGEGGDTAADIHQAFMRMNGLLDSDDSGDRSEEEAIEAEMARSRSYRDMVPRIRGPDGYFQGPFAHQTLPRPPSAGPEQPETTSLDFQFHSSRHRAASRLRGHEDASSSASTPQSIDTPLQASTPSSSLAQSPPCPSPPLTRRLFVPPPPIPAPTSASIAEGYADDSVSRRAPPLIPGSFRARVLMAMRGEGPDIVHRTGEDGSNYEGIAVDSGSWGFDDHEGEESELEEEVEEEVMQLQGLQGSSRDEQLEFLTRMMARRVRRQEYS